MTIKKGCRYLDIRLEKYGSEYYSHHGMLGASLTEMVEDIKKYIDIISGEIIIIKLSEFIDITQIDLQRIYEIIMINFEEYIADSKSHRYDIFKDNIGTLINDNDIRIVIFIDKSSIIQVNEDITDQYDRFFYDSRRYLVGDDELRIKTKGKKKKNGKKHKQQEEEEQEQEELTTQTIISNTLLQLTKGWDIDRKINQIFWDVNIENPSQLNKYISENYDSFLSVHTEFIPTLKTAIDSYSKIYFANIIIIDFMEYLPMDYIMILFINYNNCNDLQFGKSNNDCPKLTKLSKSYKTSDILSPSCEFSDELINICPRSCGLCNQWISGVPGSSCNSSLDCNGPIYKMTAELYPEDAMSVCHFVDDSASWVNSADDKKGFCLSPFPQESCGVVDFLITNIDESNIQSCDSPCIEDYECLSGYCSSRDGICLSIDTPKPTPYPTPKQGYFDHIHSNAAHDLIDFIGPMRNNENCPSLSDCMNDEFYINSLTSFGIIPIIIGSCLLGIYFCCCFIFCAWSDWAKYTFCRCLDKPNKKYPWLKWVFVVVLFAVMGVITWQCVEGLQANAAMHDHLFDTSPNAVSFKTEVFASSTNKHFSMSSLRNALFVFF